MNFELLNWICLYFIGIILGNPETGNIPLAFWYRVVGDRGWSYILCLQIFIHAGCTSFLLQVWLFSLPKPHFLSKKRCYWSLLSLALWWTVTRALKLSLQHLDYWEEKQYLAGFFHHLFNCRYWLYLIFKFLHAMWFYLPSRLGSCMLILICFVLVLGWYLVYGPLRQEKKNYFSFSCWEGNNMEIWWKSKTFTENNVVSLFLPCTKLALCFNGGDLSVVFHLCFFPPVSILLCSILLENIVKIT